MRRPDTERPVETVYIGLGTNQDPREENLRDAVHALAWHPEIDLEDRSSVYETEYVGPGSQDPYLNACLTLRTRLAPRVLLAVLKGIEERLGRQPNGHGLPRPIDLDILIFGGREFGSEDLQIPHKSMRDRAFVLEPLAEIAPEAVFPDSGETITAACAKIRRKPGPWVRKHPETVMWQGVGDQTKEGPGAAMAVHRR